MPKLLLLGHSISVQFILTPKCWFFWWWITIRVICTFVIWTTKLNGYYVIHYQLNALRSRNIRLVWGVKLFISRLTTFHLTRLFHSILTPTIGITLTLTLTLKKSMVLNHEYCLTFGIDSIMQVWNLKVDQSLILKPGGHTKSRRWNLKRVYIIGNLLQSKRKPYNFTNDFRPGITWPSKSGQRQLVHHCLALAKLWAEPLTFNIKA